MAKRGSKKISKFIEKNLLGIFAAVIIIGLLVAIIVLVVDEDGTPKNIQLKVERVGQLVGNWDPLVSESIVFSDKLKLFVSCDEGGDDPGTMSVSKNGISWERILVPVSSNKVLWVNNQFVSSGDGVMTSSNGYDWKLISGEKTYDMTYGNGMYVGVHFNRTIKYSTNLTNWTSIIMPGTFNYTKVVYGNNTFVAIKTNSTENAYSTDGINWTVGSFPSSVKDIAFGNGRFVVLYNDITNDIFTSENGIGWTTRPNALVGGTGRWRSVSYTGGKFIAMGRDDAESIISIDGITWTGFSQIPKHTGFISVAYGLGKYVSVSDEGYNMTSTDAINWDYLGKGITSWDPQSIIWSSNLKMFIMTTAYGYVQTSKDALTWKNISTPAISFPSTNIQDIAEKPKNFTEPGILVAIVSDRTIYSYDGIIWEEGVTFSVDMTSIIYGKDKFIATSGNIAYISYDGITWISIETPLDVEGMVYNDNGMYFGHSSPNLFKSKNGIDWEGVVVNTTSELYGNFADISNIVSHGNITIALGQGEEIDYPNRKYVLPYLLSIDNGKTWTMEFIDIFQDVATVAWVPFLNKFVISNGSDLTEVPNVILSSSDGLNWEKELDVPTPHDPLEHSISSPDKLLLVGSGTIAIVTKK